MPWGWHMACKRKAISPKREHMQKLPKKNSSNASGFTMVELLMTMLILTIVLVGLATLQVHTIRQVTDSKNSAEALRLGQSVLERLKAETFAPSTTTGWIQEINQNAQEMKNVSVNGVGQGPYTVERNVETGTNGLVRVSIKVSWLDTKRNTQGQYQTRDMIVTMMRQ